jgi:hypothetical protein
MKDPRFALERMVATAGALDASQESGEKPLRYLTRHQTGDWGELDSAEKTENELSLEQRFRLLSAYVLRKGARIWIIT